MSVSRAQSEGITMSGGGLYSLATMTITIPIKPWFGKILMATAWTTCTPTW